MRPDCIVFDEPTAMLDPKGRQEVMDIIKKLHGEGITIVLITHFMDEAAQADRVVIMDGGKIVLDGKPEEVFIHTNEIRAIALDVPLAVEISEKLRAKGIDVPQGIITMEDMVEFVCRSKQEI